MDEFEAIKVVQDRILELESEHITKKVIGYLCLHYEEHEIIRLAFGPDILIKNLILKAKVALSSQAIVSPPISPSVNPVTIPDPSLQYACFQSASPLRRSLPPRLAGPSHEEFRQTELMRLEDQFEPVNSVASGFSDYFCSEGGVSNISVRHNQHVLNAPEVPVKTCHYFKKGICKKGNKCRYSHGQCLLDNFCHLFGPNANKFGYEDQVVTPGSLELLEMEITELLKSIDGSPLSISSLPMLYFERYRRTLKAEGYYPGIKLAKLLARLNNTLKLIYRPGGQHVIVLAEDSGKNLEVRTKKSDPVPVNGSRKLFLNFRPESTFTEEDVLKYFR